MQEPALRFPTYFPSGCPPVEAEGEEKILFRLCAHAPPTEEDFISYYLKNPEKFKNNINSYGLSVFETEESCRKAFDKAPKLRSKYKFCAKGINTPERGKTLSTPNGRNPQHITWWIYEGVEPHTFFVNCEERGDDNG